MIKDIVIIAKKEFVELKIPIVRLLPMSVLVLLPLVAVAIHSGGNPIISTEMIVYLLPSLLGGSIAYELTRNNIKQERREKTLDILLISEVNKLSIIFGKAIPGVIMGTLIAIIGNLLLCIDSEYQKTIKISNLIIIPIIIYLIIMISIMISILIKDEKTGTFMGIFLMILFCTPIVMIKNAVFSIILAVIVSIILTVISSKMLRLV